MLNATHPTLPEWLRWNYSNKSSTGIAIRYPREYTWCDMAIELVKKFIDQSSDVVVVTRDVKSSGLNTGFGIGNKNRVSPDKLLLTTLTTSPEELSKSSANYLIYPRIKDLPRDLSIASDRCLIVLVSWNDEADELSRLLSLELSRLRYTPIDYQGCEITYTTLKRSLNYQHSIDYLTVKRSAISPMLPNINYPDHLLIESLEGWNHNRDVHEELPEITDFTWLSDLYHYTPKLAEVHQVIVNNPQVKHVIVTGYVGNYGAHMISRVLSQYGINSFLASLRTKSTAIDTIKDFSQSRDGSVLVTNFAPITEVVGVGYLHLIDTYDFNLLSKWIALTCNRRQLEVRLYLANLDPTSVDDKDLNLETRDQSQATVMFNRINRLDQVMSVFDANCMDLNHELRVN